MTDFLSLPDAIAAHVSDGCTVALELLDLSAERGLRDVQPPCGPHEVPLIRDSDERVYQPQVEHGPPPVGRRYMRVVHESVRKRHLPR